MSTIYLYVKQHSVTGLKYFGKTIRDPFKYHGSGKRWKNHIRKHGTNLVNTISVWTFLDIDSARDFAIDFSNSHDIVESEEWANLVVEDVRNSYVHKENVPWHKGKRGLYKHNEQTLRNLSESHKGLRRSEQAISKTAKANKGRKNSPEVIEKFRRINSGSGNPQFGKKLITNGVENKLVHKEVFHNEYESIGWQLGSTLPRDPVTGRLIPRN